MEEEQVKSAWATAYTDASFFAKQRSGTWSVYIRSDYGIIKETGHCPTTCENITMCEVFAAGMAIILIKERWEFITSINLNSDNTFVTSYLKEETKNSKNEKLARLQENFKVHVKHNKYYVVFRHVKAHQNNKRSNLNAIADGEARRLNFEFNNKKHDLSRDRHRARKRKNG